MNQKKPKFKTLVREQVDHCKRQPGWEPKDAVNHMYKWYVAHVGEYNHLGDCGSIQDLAQETIDKAWKDHGYTTTYNSKYAAEKGAGLLYGALSWHYKGTMLIKPQLFMVYAMGDDGETVFWNNSDGWGCVETGEIHTAGERESNLSMPYHTNGCDWLLVEECYKRVIQEKIDRDEYPVEINNFGGTLDRSFVPWRDLFDAWYLANDKYHWYCICDNYYHSCHYDLDKLMMITYTEGDIVKTIHTIPEKFIADLQDTWNWHDGIESYDAEPIDWTKVHDKLKNKSHS